MQEFTTQCPHCSTAFKLTQNQLEAAHGAVRCGACMHVFNAKAHLSQSEEQHAQSSARTVNDKTATDETALTEPALSNISKTVNETTLTETTLTETTVNETTANSTHWTQALTNDIEKIYQYLASELDLKNHPELAEQIKNERWGQALLSELNSTLEESASQASTPLTEVTTQPDSTNDNAAQHIPKNTPLPQKLKPSAQLKDYKQSGLHPKIRQALDETKNNEITSSPSDTPITPRFATPVGLEKETHVPAAPNEPSHENWSNHLLDELENQSRNIAENIKKALNASNKAAPTDEEKPVTLSDLARIPLSEAYPNSSDINTPSSEDNTKGKGIADNTTASQTALDSLISELDANIENPRPMEKTSFFQGSTLLISLLAIFALLLQVAIFDIQRFAQDLRFRPYYETACRFISCSLPALERFEDIKGTKLVVRSHPKQKENALIVDMHLKNEAPFPQAFPDIELSFTSLSGDLVARRRFTPDEYRGDTLRKLKLMPPEQPLHLTLEIVNPGNDATNYQLNLYPHREN